MGLWASFSFPSQRRAGSMSKPPYRVLRIVLGFFSLLLAVASILLIFSSKPLIMRMFMHPPESEISTLLLAAVKEIGGLALALSAMLFFASRDPARNVAVVDGMTLGLCILAVTPLLSLYIYPGCAETLSELFDLGTLFSAVGAGRCPLLSAAAGDGLETRREVLSNKEAGVLCQEKPSSFRQALVRRCVVFSNFGRTSPRDGSRMRAPRVSALSRRSCATFAH